MFDEALAIVADGGDRVAEIQASLGKAFARTSVEPEGKARQLEAMLDQMIPELVQLGDEAGLAIAFLCRAQVGWMNCRYTDAKDECDQALTSAQGAGDVQWMLKATTTRVSCALGFRPPPSELRGHPRPGAGQNVGRRIPTSDHSLVVGCKAW